MILDGRNRAIIVAELLARVVTTAGMISLEFVESHISPQKNTEIGGDSLTNRAIGVHSCNACCSTSNCGILVAPYRAILRCYRSDTPHPTIPLSGRLAAPQNGAIPPLGSQFHTRPLAPSSNRLWEICVFGQFPRSVVVASQQYYFRSSRILLWWSRTRKSKSVPQGEANAQEASSLPEMRAPWQG